MLLTITIVCNVIAIVASIGSIIIFVIITSTAITYCQRYQNHP